MWPPEGVWQKSCDHCAAQKMVCTVTRIWVSNWKWQDQSGGEGSWPKKKIQVEVGSDAELERSRTGGWRQGVSTCLGGDQGALKGAEWIPEEDFPDGGLGAGEDEDDSTMRE